MAAAARNVEKRGGQWYLRWRVPARFREVECRPEINVSLKTDSPSLAADRAALMRMELTAEWERRLASAHGALGGEEFGKILEMGEARGLGYTTTEKLLNGKIDELIERLDAVAQEPSNSSLVTLALGGVDLPSVKVSEMPERMARILSEDVGGKNPRQDREWNNKWKRAAKNFIACVGDRPVAEISVADAEKFQTFWSKKRDSEKQTTDHVNKEIGRMRAIVDAYFKEIEVKNYSNPFSGMSLEKTGAESRSRSQGKRELPVKWIPDVLLNFELISSLNDEARDIGIISGETGTRGSEVYDLPKEHIFLDAEVPHFLVAVEEEGDQQRQVKNPWSIRKVPLIGHALEAMKRHPEGFPRYRGKANYSNNINKYLKENGLFPAKGITIKALRHTFETRLRRAGVENEERAQLMGHSLRQLRGREVYGDETELRIRALYLELIAFPTDDWVPRSHAEIHAEIERVLNEEGFRTK